MSKSRLEWKVGLFVFIGLVLLGGLMIEFSKGLNLFRNTYDINLRSSNIGGLRPRASVLMSGVQVGTVSDIKLSPTGESVTMVLRIYGSYQIHQDARFVIEQSGFLGDQYVGIIPTENKKPLFKNGDNAEAEPPFNMVEFIGSSGDLIKRIEGTVAKLDAVFTNITELLLTPETLTNLSSAVRELRQLSEKGASLVDSLNGVVDSNAPNIAITVSNLTEFSQQLNVVAAGITNLLATNAPVLSRALKNVETSTDNLNAMLTDAKAGKGVAGKLLTNEEMSADVSRIVQNLSITSSNLNRLGLWGILWKRKAPRNEPERAPSQTLEAPKNPYRQ